MQSFTATKSLGHLGGSFQQGFPPPPSSLHRSSSPSSVYSFPSLSIYKARTLCPGLLLKYTINHTRTAIMGFWNGTLRNSPLDITIDLEVITTHLRFRQTNPFSSVLLVAITAAYLPQIARIVTLGSTQGLSPYFVLFNAIYSNIQFAHALLFAAYAYPTTEEPVLALIGDGKLTGSRAFGGILGLLQVALQWACSITLYV